MQKLNQGLHNVLPFEEQLAEWEDNISLNVIVVEKEIGLITKDYPYFKFLEQLNMLSKYNEIQNNMSKKHTKKR